MPLQASPSSSTKTPDASHQAARCVVSARASLEACLGVSVRCVSAAETRMNANQR